MSKKHLPQRVPDDIQGTVLLAFEDAAELAQTREWLAESDFQLVVASDPTEAVELIRRRLDLDVVIAEHGLGGSPAALLEAAEASPQGLEVILAGPADVFVVTQAMAAGATSFLPHPVTHTDLLTQVMRAVHRARARQRSEDRRLAYPREVSFEGIVGTTPRMQEVMEVLRKVAPTDAPVVILGESGTGKELIARAIHDNSPRAQRGEFVPLHLHATPQGLLESELFGHKRGAFTDARTDRVGKLELANGGTLFLDELGDIPLETQTKLLRVLETHRFEPVGSNTPIESDFRIIAATNQDLEARIERREFREELWYRLNVVTIRLPPLRERRADIPLLVDHYVHVFGERYGKNIEGVEREAMLALTRHSWRGNIRELRNVVQNMVVLAEGPKLTLGDIPRGIRDGAAGEAPAGGELPLAGRTMEDIEREAIRETLKLTGGNRKAAADMLQIGERTLYRKIEKYDL